jgi:hypothetical protein
MVRHSLHNMSLRNYIHNTFVLTCLIFIVGCSNTEPLLDEDMESVTPILNRMVTEDDDRRTLRQIIGTPSIVDWVEQNVGDTHIGKRKLKAGSRKDKRKKAKTTEEGVLESDESTPSPNEGGSPPYQESNLSISTSSDDDDGDGGGSRIEPSQPPIQFTGVKYQQIYLYSIHIIFLSSLTHALSFSGESHYTHVTQDTDHGASQSHRETITDQDKHTGRGRGSRRQHYLSLVDSSSSQNIGSSTPYAHDFDSYMAPDPSQLVQNVQWVYEYENPEFYNMLVQ